MTDPLLGRCLGGRYRVDRLLSSGGMGAVYEATQIDIKRRVALKVLLVGNASESERVRFEREARALASIHSPHVVEIRDFQAPSDGPAFLVMELLDGQSLSTLVKQGGALPPERVARIALQVLTGLAEAHRHQIVHRDVKPANVVLVPSAALGEIVKVVDFGVSTADVTLIPGTLGTSFVGTLHYMAPEQATGRAVDGRSDVYGVGASMYYACTCRRPVEGSTAADVVERLINGSILPLAAVLPGADPAFAAIVDRALAREPAMRWQSADEMAGALRRWLEQPRMEAMPLSALPTRVPAAPQGTLAPSRMSTVAPNVPDTAAPPSIAPERHFAPAPNAPNASTLVSPVAPGPATRRLGAILIALTVALGLLALVVGIGVVRYLRTPVETPRTATTAPPSIAPVVLEVPTAASAAPSSTEQRGPNNGKDEDLDGARAIQSRIAANKETCLELAPARIVHGEKHMVVKMTGAPRCTHVLAVSGRRENPLALFVKDPHGKATRQRGGGIDYEICPNVLGEYSVTITPDTDDGYSFASVDCEAEQVEEPQ